MENLNDIAALLHVEEKLRAHGNLFKHIHDVIMQELRDINASFAPAPPEPAPAIEGDTTDNPATPRKEEEWPETSLENTDETASSPKEPESATAASSQVSRRM